jgi:reactive intermediate/imine deaminase
MMVLAMVAAGCTAPEQGPHAPAEFLTTPENAARGFPFSEAVRVDNLLFLSGKVGVDPETGDLAPGGIGPETRQTLENIEVALQRYGSSMDRVVKCTVFLADIAEWGAMNEVYREFFSGSFPARSAVGGGGLALGARVEIECIAVVERAEPR